MPSNDPNYQREYMRRHYRANKRYYVDKAAKRTRKRNELLQSLKSVPCADCGVTYPYYVMDFDHRPGFEKEVDMNRQARWIGEARLQAELAKCDVVCSNCHRIRTHSRNEGIA